MTRTLRTTNDVFRALGGISAVAKITSSSYNASANWKSFERFPARFYLVLSDALAQRGYRVSPHLFGMAQ